MPDFARDTLLDLYSAAVAGADPGRATAEALTARLTRLDPPVVIIAAGKAAWAMSVAATEVFSGCGIAPDSGVIVGADLRPPPHPALLSLAGDHPVPGPRSRRGATAVGTVVARAAGSGTALVLLSGGASSLMAAPVEGVNPDDLARLFHGLLRSGADIAVTNAVRKRFMRWAGGRLAAALSPARVECLVVSDVVGDDLATIASGPCVPDPLRAADVRELIARHDLEVSVPEPLRLLLERESPWIETPKPGDPAFARTSCEVILGNATALRAAAERARRCGISDVRVIDTPLIGEAAPAGTQIAHTLLAVRDEMRAMPGGSPRSACVIWGGETTVKLGAGAAPGGRCQELALSAARWIAGARGEGILLLAAGSDGRDGPTDAAGAIVGPATWRAVGARGRDPVRDLATHASYAALDSVGALVRTGQSGTNVGDVVIGLVALGSA